MWRIRNEAACFVKYGTRKVKSLLDVSTDACLLQGSTHLLGDGHEPMAKDAEHDGIYLAVA